jgi:hypothetical protein
MNFCRIGQTWIMYCLDKSSIVLAAVFLEKIGPTVPMAVELYAVSE